MPQNISHTSTSHCSHLHQISFRLHKKLLKYFAVQDFCQNLLLPWQRLVVHNTKYVLHSKYNEASHTQNLVIIYNTLWIKLAPKCFSKILVTMVTLCLRNTRIRLNIICLIVIICTRFCFNCVKFLK